MLHSFAFWLHLIRAAAFVASFRISVENAAYYLPKNKNPLIFFFRYWFALTLFKQQHILFIFIQIKISSKFALLPWYLRKKIVFTHWSTGIGFISIIMGCAHHWECEFCCRIHQLVSQFFRLVFMFILSFRPCSLSIHFVHHLDFLVFKQNFPSRKWSSFRMNGGSVCVWCI